MAGSSKPPAGLSGLLRELLRTTEASYPDRAHTLWGLWDDAVGPELAKRSRPLELRRGRLTVAVTSAPWMQQLSFLRRHLCDALNRAVGQDVVKEVRFRIAEVAPPRPARTLAPPPEWLSRPLPAEAAAAIDAEVSAVHDPALRESIREVRVRAEQVRRFREARGEPSPPPSTSRRGRGGTGASGA